MSAWLLLSVIILYMVGLIAVARWGDKNIPQLFSKSAQATIYAGTLAVYATSWTFYGAVGTASRAGWDYLPIYLGPILLFTLGFPLVKRFIGVAKANNATSLPDYLASRYGKSPVVAALVTLIAVIAALPYIALQLRSVGMTFNHIASNDLGDLGIASDLAITIALALFAMVFGTRKSDLTAGNKGLMLVIAVEALVKLLALFAVALLAYSLVNQNDITTIVAYDPFSGSIWNDRFWILTFISAGAVILLPRQFHVAVVEAEDTTPLKRARWAFPIYLILISLAVIPITMAGHAINTAGTSDLLVLSLPLSAGSPALTLLAFLGGFSAATGMIIVCSVALATMITNDLLLVPGLAKTTGTLARRSRIIRRLTIGAIMFCAFLYQLSIEKDETLASLGILSFSATAQFIPAVIASLFWARANRFGVIAGLIAGISLWFLMLMLPAYSSNPSMIAVFFGKLSGLNLDALTWGIVLSLSANIFGLIIGSLISPARMIDRLQAHSFAAPATMPVYQNTRLNEKTRVNDLTELMRRCIGIQSTQEALQAYSLVSGKPVQETDLADSAFIVFVENQISRVTGATSARTLVQSALSGSQFKLEDVVSLVDTASKRLQFSEALLTATLDHLPQGVSVIDKDLKLVAWNKAYVSMFKYPEGLIYVGRPVRDIIEHNIKRDPRGHPNTQEAIERRLSNLAVGKSHIHERVQPDGRILRLEGKPMPGGAYVTSFTDVTETRLREASLEDARRTLEERVESRTKELASAKAMAEKATRSKTRFLAAASHDLLQPLNAARLFVSALKADIVKDDKALELAEKTDQSIAAADHLLRSLLDISRLDTDGMLAKNEPFDLSVVLKGLEHDFSIIAAEKGLSLEINTPEIILHSDSGLLRSVVQNLVSNAIRYTECGHVLVKSKLRGTGLYIQIWDSGPGIPTAMQKRIFEEFVRLDRGGKGEHDGGAGLGLAITKRILKLLDFKLALLSSPGRGSVFTIRIPLNRVHAGNSKIEKDKELKSTNPVMQADKDIAHKFGARILCLDDDRSVLDGYQQLLLRWEYTPILASNINDAVSAFSRDTPPELIIIDYRLGDTARGTDFIQKLLEKNIRLPSVILITAEKLDKPTINQNPNISAMLQKPVAPARLRALMRQLLRST